MGERTSYAPGTFCWVELATTDAAGAKDFYAALLGWEAADIPISEGMVYSMQRVDGRDVAGLYQLSEEEAPSRPPAWLSYVSVEDADRMADQVQALGGGVMGAALDVMDAGRMAVATDPEGAVFGLWQPKDHIGATLVNAPGALSLNQLNTSDVEGASRFYSALFGWDIEQVVPGPQPYWGIRNGGNLNGGIMAMGPEIRAPAHWLPYFTTEDLEGAAEMIGRGGGAVVVPPMAAGPEGRILVARDPQGAFFALWEGPVDP
jgi:predicted enzyme related to lactoylglutathione lyase